MPTHVQNQPKSLPTQTHGQKDNAAKMKDKMTGKINNETLTTCIKHLAVSGLSSVSARIKSSCNLIENRFEMPNVSCTQPLCTSVKRHDTADNLLLKDRKRKTK